MSRYGTVDPEYGVGPATGEPGDDGPVDGRRRRRERNRNAVLNALLELYAEGDLTPGTTAIAERAGISPRSLFRYFDDVEDLNRAAIERQLSGVRPLLDHGADPAMPTADKVQRLVDARLRLFEHIAPAARAARACAHRHAVVATQIHESRAFLRHQVERLFAPELDGARSALVPVVDALCSFETYELLRTEQRLSRTKTAAALTAALCSLLDQGDSP